MIKFSKKCLWRMVAWDTRSYFPGFAIIESKKRTGGR